MLIEATELLYKDMPLNELAKCFLICPMNTQGTALQLQTPSNNASMNSWLRKAIQLATGRDYTIQSGPLPTAASAKRPAGAVAYTWKGFRRAMQQLGLGKGLSDLDLRAICDWEGDSGERYFEVTEDVRGRLMRQLHGVPCAPLDQLVLCYAGSAPDDLSYGKTTCGSTDALREWAIAKIKSAIPSYSRGECTDAHSMITRIRQLLHPFKNIPKPTPGTFTGRPWGIVPSPKEYDCRAIAPQQSVLQQAMMLAHSLSAHSYTVDASILGATVAAASALAVALSNPPASSEAATVSSVLRTCTAVVIPGLQTAVLDCAARAALLASSHHSRDSWPSLFLKITISMTNSITSNEAYNNACYLLNQMKGVADAKALSGISNAPAFAVHVATASHSMRETRATVQQTAPPTFSRPPHVGLPHPTAPPSLSGPPRVGLPPPTAPPSLSGQPVPTTSSSDDLGSIGLGPLAHGAVRDQPGAVVVVVGDSARASFADIAIDSLEVTPTSSGSVIVKGNTAALLTHLRALDAYFDKIAKTWTIPCRNVQRFLLLRAAAKERLDSSSLGSALATVASQAAITVAPSIPSPTPSALFPIFGGGPGSNLPVVRASCIASDSRPLDFPKDDRRLDGTYQKYVFWHGFCNDQGWPAFRLSASRTDKVWQHSSTQSKIATVCSYIDSVLVPPVAVLVNDERPSDHQMLQAYKLCLNFDNYSQTNSYTNIYNCLRRSDAVLGEIVERTRAAMNITPASESASYAPCTDVKERKRRRS